MEEKIPIANNFNIVNGKKVLLYLPEKMVDDLHVIMKNTYQYNRTELVRQMLTDYILKYKKQYPEWFKESEE